MSPSGQEEIDALTGSVRRGWMGKGPKHIVEPVRDS